LWPRFRYYALVAFLIICLLGGGASRPEVLSLLYLRPLGILILAALLLSPGPWEFRRYRALFILLGLFAATMAVQLIPLPPGLWLALPGHGQFAEAADAAGFAQPWRPISLSPDMTLNSILALLPCLVVLVGFAGIENDRRRDLLLILVGFVCVDAGWGILQFVGGPESATYLYRITNNDTPVGLFSNRNHHAVLMALGFPLLALWASKSTHNIQRDRVRFWVAVAIGLSLMPMILATGSRAGLILGALSLAISFWLARPSFAFAPGRWRPAAIVAGLLLPVAIVGATIFAHRAVSLDRLQGMGALGEEQRVAALPVLMTMLKTFGPQGIGYGAFDPAFRVYEPDSALQPFYLNHAHDDLIELVLTGGWVALLVLGLFLFWYGRRVLGALRGGRGAWRAKGHARLGAVMVALIFGASLVDYPLRTPLFAAIFTIACAWLAGDAGLGQGPDAAAKPPAGEGSGRRRRLVARAAIVVPLIVGLGWVAMGVTASAALGGLQPSLTMGWWPFDAGANAAAAAAVLEEQHGRSGASLAEPLAWASLRREPVNTGAVRSLALAAALRGDEARAVRLMAYSELLSRRDLPTELWFIESRVQANDIRGALVHYDHALRTTPESRELLFPILIQAADSPGVLVPLAQVVARRPSWWRDFVTRFVSEGRSPAALEAIVEAVRLDPEDVIEHGLQVTAIGRLIELGGYAQAARIYERTRRSRTAGLVHNGDFEAENAYAPIDWALTDTVDLAGIVQAGSAGGNGHILLLVAQNGASGVVARQLVMLRPGRYRFSAIAGDVAATGTDQPEISLSCAGTNEPIFRLRAAASPPAGRNLSQDFAVGNSACPAQWLTIGREGTSEQQGPNPWIDRVAIMPL
jgi:O-antigen ligase